MVEFNKKCEEYQEATGRDPRFDDDGNPRSQINVIKTLQWHFYGKWRHGERT